MSENENDRTEVASEPEVQLDEALTDQALTDEAQPGEALTDDAQTGEALTDQDQIDEAQIDEAQIDEAQLDEAQPGEALTDQAEDSEPQVDEPQISDPQADDVQQEQPAQPTWRRFSLTDDTEAALAAAVTAVRAGEVIVLPTDTVYGIAADATNAAAVQRLLNAKVRGRDMPPPVLISDALMLGSLVDEVPEQARALTAAHWPGALTVILKAQPSLGMDLGETEGTIAVRVPDHESTRGLLRRTGPLAVSSANVSGNPAATTVDEAIGQLGESVSVYVDGGPVAGAGASSIIDFSTSDEGRLVRLGALTVEQLQDVLPQLDLGEFAPQPEPEKSDTPEESESEAERPTPEELTLEQSDDEELEEQVEDMIEEGGPVASETEPTAS